MKATDTFCFYKDSIAECGPVKTDQNGVHQEMKLEGYDAPVIIDCDPAKRPQNTDKVFYSVLCGPKSPVTWQQARQIVGEAARLAPSMSQWRADWMKQMTAIVQGDGEPAPGWPTQSMWHRPS